ncbi:MAG: hypothetical protein K8T20_01760 [Planctomycetes bacterium]|nr:hypothetical protein [Planctomycetota bacterium]
MRFLLGVLFLATAACSQAGEIVTSTVEWITLSGDSQALWVEGSSPDGPIKLELRVADDTLVLASRETIASAGRFSSLLRPHRLPNASYSLEIVSGRTAARIPILLGTEEERQAYARPEVLWMGGAYDRIVALTDELHRFREECADSRDVERWRLWSPGWEERRVSLSHELDEFRAQRNVLGRAHEFYRLVSSLCFAKTLHALYAAELNSRGGEPGGGEASDWSAALAEQLDGFRESRTPPSEAELASWAKDLSDEDATVRDRASRRLAIAGAGAREALIRAARGTDPEGAARARELLERIK